ncbi:MAG: hypothetical protein WBE72_07590 [Terracidiphilus sp.]
MEESPASLFNSLSEVILRNLKIVQVSQAEQVTANDRLERAIEELRVEMESQFARIAAQLLACRAELAATATMLKAVQAQGGSDRANPTSIIH